MNKKILIIGSTGFIGKHAVVFFKKIGYDVFTADIVLKNDENYTLLNPENIDFSSLFLKQKYDVCLNASGAANVGLSFQYPFVDYCLNTLNVFNILNAIKIHCPSCKFINLSSAAVYGNPSILPIKEDATKKPLSPYGFHKFYSEKICEEFFELFNIKTISLRIFSAYGEGLQKQLFWDIYKKIIDSKNNQICLFGTGNETRDFIYIEDLLNAIELIIKKIDFNGEAINVSSGIETSIKDAVETFIKNYNPNIVVSFNNQIKEGDPIHWKADVSKLKSIGYKSFFDINKGLNNYSNWLKQIHD